MKFILYDDGAVLTGPSTYNGMTMTGPLRLNKYPSDDIEAVNKEYVDSMARNLNADSVNTGILPLEVFPDMTGDLTHAAGSGLIDLSNSPVIPGTYPKVTVNRGGIVTSGGVLTPGDIPGFSWNKISPASRPTTAAGYGITDAVNRNNGVVLGNVRSPSDPTQPEDLVTKGYADDRISNVSAYSVGDIVAFDINVTPEGFLRCNGGSVSKTMYSELYSIIGDRFKGGDFSIGAGKPWKQQYHINTQQTGEIGTWVTETNLLPLILQSSQAVVTKNRVYLLGGSSGFTSPNSVYSAPINSDGTIGSWVTETNSLPYGLFYSQAVVTKNRVYLLGGSVSSGVTNQVLSAPINSDGTIGSWVTETNSLPESLRNSQAVVTKNRVYLLGGYAGSGVTNQVLSAPINSDGTIGSWVTETNTLPQTLHSSQAVVTKNRVYLLGGNSNQVFSAPINSDGTIGSWVTETNSLPESLHAFQAVVTKNRVYLLGGNSNQVLSGPINSDGTIGTWVTETNTLPESLHAFQAVVTKNRVYLLGGNVGGRDSNQLFSAPFAGGLNDYSLYYNGGVPLEENVSQTFSSSGSVTVPANAVNVKVVGKGSNGTAYKAGYDTYIVTNWSVGPSTTTCQYAGSSTGTTIYPEPPKMTHHVTKPAAHARTVSIGNICDPGYAVSNPNVYRLRTTDYWIPNYVTNHISAIPAADGSPTTINVTGSGEETFPGGTISSNIAPTRTINLPDGSNDLTMTIPSGGSVTLSYDIRESISDEIINTLGNTFDLPDYINEDGVNAVNYIKY